MIQKEFPNLVEQAIELNDGLRKLSYEYRKMLSPEQYAKEFGTIHIHVGRRAGKTQYIRDYITAKDCAVVPSRQMGRVLSDALERLADVFYASQLNGLKSEYAGRRYNIIYIDEPKLCADYGHIADIYANLIRDYDQRVIMLGE